MNQSSCNELTIKSIVNVERFHEWSSNGINIYMTIIFEPPRLSRNRRNGNVSFRVDLKVPYAEKDSAKKLGARWDPAKKSWYVVLDENRSIKPFIQWT